MAERRRRRIRRTARRISGRRDSPKIEKLKKMQNRLIELETEISVKQAQAAEMREDILQFMLAQKIDECSIDTGKLEIDVPSGRSVTKVDPREFFEYVGEDEFFDSISVSVTKAREHLSDKELKSISETTPAKTQEPRLKLSIWGVNSKPPKK